MLWLYKIWHFDSSATENSGILGYEAIQLQLFISQHSVTSQKTSISIPRSTENQIVTIIFQQTPN